MALNWKLQNHHLISVSDSPLSYKYLLIHLNFGIYPQSMLLPRFFSSFHLCYVLDGHGPWHIFILSGTMSYRNHLLNLNVPKKPAATEPHEPSTTSHLPITLISHSGDLRSPWPNNVVSVMSEDALIVSSQAWYAGNFLSISIQMSVCGEFQSKEGISVRGSIPLSLPW